MTVVPRLPERFTDVEPLSSTALERTFRARDQLLQRDVMLRLPAAHAWSAWSAPVRERLLREARVLAKVHHDAIVPILWVEETDEGPLLVMPPPEGERLTERLQHGTLSVEAAVALGIRVAEALACVHFHQIVHRGVGPDAIWILPDGSCKLGSFTFAKAFDARLPSSIDHRRRSDPDAAQLLPPYPAPEQLAGRPAEPRVDVFALGNTLFRCLAGVDAEQGAAGGRADLRAHRKDVPPALAAVLRTCMQPAPTARYPNAQALVTALQQLRDAAKGGGLSRRTVAAGGVAAVAFGALGLWQLWAPIGTARSDSGTVQAAGGTPPLVQKYSDTYAHGHALLIGVGEGRNGWPHAKLNGPANEVEAVKQRLLALNPKFWGEEDAIKPLVNEQATKPAILGELNKLRTIGRDDCVFVYFAGHGVVRSDTSSRFWLVCSDAAKRTADEGDGADAGFLTKEELTDFAACDFKHMFVVLDCCFAGKVFEAKRGGKVEEPKNESASPLLRERSREFLVSVGANRTAMDAPVGGTSAFCREFLAALAPADPKVRFVSASSIFERVLARLPAAQPDYQNFEDSRGRFLFFVQPAPVAPK